ncbi:MAG: MFS transporter [Thermoleophilia bacterium]|nr:MFS transporter [Thermoleophilia bacterium]
MSSEQRDPAANEGGSQTQKAGWLVLATIMLATALANVASVCLFPQLVVLSAEFGRPVNEIVWALVAFAIIATGVGGVAAALGAVVGNRRMLVVALSFLLVGSLVAALSTNLAFLIVARIIQGVGMAIQALAIGIVAAYWRGEGMRRAMSMVVVGIGLGAVAGFLLSGFIWRGGGDWRTVFWVVTGASAVDLVLTFRFLKETPRKKGVRIDYVGCVGLIVWSAPLLLALSQANAWGWGSTRTLVLLVVGAALLAGWVWWELRNEEPLIELRLLARMGVWQGAVVWVGVTLAMGIPATAIPYLFQTPTESGFGFGRSLFVVSLVLAIPAVMMVLLSPTTTSLMRKVGAKGAMLLGALFGLGGFGMAFAHGSPWLVSGWLVTTGIMAAWATSASYAVGAEAVSPEKGIIVGTIYNTAGGLGTAIASASAGYVLSLRKVAVEVGTADGPVTQYFPAEETFTWSLMIVGVAALIGVLAAVSIRSRRLRAESRTGGSRPG